MHIKHLTMANFLSKSSVEMSRTSGENKEPVSYTATENHDPHHNTTSLYHTPCWIFRPYEKGYTFNIWRRAASENPTLSSFLMRCTSLRISMVPLEIFVAMERAWKNEVFSGPRPVFWGVTNTSIGAIEPALAGASTCPGIDHMTGSRGTTTCTPPCSAQ